MLTHSSFSPADSVHVDGGGEGDDCESVLTYEWTCMGARALAALLYMKQIIMTLSRRDVVVTVAGVLVLFCRHRLHFCRSVRRGYGASWMASQNDKPDVKIIKQSIAL